MRVWAGSVSAIVRTKSPPWTVCVCVHVHVCVGGKRSIN